MQAVIAIRGIAQQGPNDRAVHKIRVKFTVVRVYPVLQRRQLRGFWKSGFADARPFRQAVRADGHDMRGRRARLVGIQLHEHTGLFHGLGKAPRLERLIPFRADQRVSKAHKARQIVFCGIGQNRIDHRLVTALLEQVACVEKTGPRRDDIKVRAFHDTAARKGYQLVTQ